MAETFWRTCQICDKKFSTDNGDTWSEAHQHEVDCINANPDHPYSKPLIEHEKKFWEKVRQEIPWLTKWKAK